MSNCPGPFCRRCGECQPHASLDETCPEDEDGYGHDFPYEAAPIGRTNPS